MTDPDSMIDRLRQLLKDEFVSIEESKALSPSVFDEEGHYVGTDECGNQVGIFVRILSWSFDESPYFYFCSNDPDHEWVIEPFKHGLAVVKVPKDYIASTYGDESKTTREPSLLGGNAPRDLEYLAPNHVILPSKMISVGKAQNCLSAVQILQSLERDQIVCANHTVNYARDETHARELLNKLCFLIQ